MTAPIWITGSGIAVLLILSVVAYRRQLSDAYPWFTTYIYFSTFAWVIGMCCMLRSPIAYGYFYYSHELLVDVLTVRLFCELWRNVFGTWRAIPVNAPAQVAKRLTISLLATAGIAVLLYQTHVLFRMQMVFRIELLFDSFILLALLGIALYSRVLGITWPVTAHNIATGFTAFLTIDVFSILFRAQLRAGTPILVRASASITYVLTMAVWSWNFRKQEPAPAELTAVDLRAMIDSMADMKEAALDYGIGAVRQTISFDTR